MALLCRTPATKETSHSFASEGDVHVLEHGEAGKDTCQLERPPDAQAAYLFRCRACDRTPIIEDPPGIGPFIARDHMKQRGFARAIGADQPGNRSPFDRDRAALQGVNSSVCFGDFLYFE